MTTSGDAFKHLCNAATSPVMLRTQTVQQGEDCGPQFRPLKMRSRFLDLRNRIFFAVEKLDQVSGLSKLRTIVSNEAQSYHT